MEQQTTQCIGQVFFGHMFFKGTGFKKETGTQMVATLFGKAVIQQNSVHGTLSNIKCVLSLPYHRQKVFDQSF